jgi:hypothetical protein
MSCLKVGYVVSGFEVIVWAGFSLSDLLYV